MIAQWELLDSLIKIATRLSTPENRKPEPWDLINASATPDARALPSLWASFHSLSGKRVRKM